VIFISHLMVIMYTFKTIFYFTSPSKGCCLGFVLVKFMYLKFELHKSGLGFLFKAFSELGLLPI
jgi:hypothetical protein